MSNLVNLAYTITSAYGLKSSLKENKPKEVSVNLN